MLNQAAVEALYSATYVENYLDCVENLPDDLQRHLSRMRELDVTYQGTCCNFFFCIFYLNRDGNQFGSPCIKKSKKTWQAATTLLFLARTGA